MFDLYELCAYMIYMFLESFCCLFDDSKWGEVYREGEQSMFSTHVRVSLTTPIFILLFSLLPPPLEMCFHYRKGDGEYESICL